MENYTLQGVALSPLQRRISTLQKDTANLAQYCRIRIARTYDEETLSKALKNVVNATDVLQIRLEERADMFFPMQVEETNVELPEIEESTLAKGEVLRFPAQEGEQRLANIRVAVTEKAEEHFLLDITVPTIFCDLFTAMEIGRQIAVEYAGLTTEGEPPMVINSLQFAEWQNALWADPDDYALEFWNNYPYRQAYQYELPFSRITEQQPGFQPKVMACQPDRFIQQALSERVKEGEEMMPVFMACLLLVLNRLVETEPMAIGYLSDQRSIEETRNALGLMIRLLPMALKMDTGQSFNALCERLTEELERTKEWEEYFGKENTLEATDYFRVLFQYTAFHLSDEENRHFQVQDGFGCSDRFDFNAQVLHTDEGFRFYFAYDSGKLKHEDLLVLEEQYLAVLRSVLENPELPVSELLKTAPHSVEEAKVPEKGDKSFVDVLRRSATEHASNTAVSDGTTSLTYEELDRKSDALAHYLQKEHQVSEGDLIALHYGRSVDLIVLIWGIWKSGAAYLPIDYEMPAQRVDYILQDANCKMLFRQPGTIDNTSDCPNIVVDEGFWQAIPGDAPESCPSVSPDQLAYVIYTSGSTGNPKGVMITHDSLVNYVEGFTGRCNVTAEDRTLLFSSVAFDLSYTSLWSCLAKGAAVYIHEQSQHLDPIRFIKDLITHQVTFIKLTPSHFSLLINDPDFDTNCNAYKLRLIALGGEAPDPQAIQQYLQKRKETLFVNHYGPTETCVGVMMKEITFDTISDFAAKPHIGTPLQDTQAYIMTPDGSQAVTGQTGELTISGRGVARGYLGNEALTAEKFIDNPFATRGKLYKTGDRARRLSDGSIEFLGRSDNQVKVRGYRIELGEIAQVMMSYDLLRQVFLRVKRDQESGEALLVAFLVTEDSFEQKALETFLSKALPYYMVPSRFFQVKNIPLLPNGKTDLKTLDRWAEEYETQVYVAPETPVEKALTDIWQQVLNKPKIGIQDDFFQLGGHSLKAAQIVTRLFKATGKRIELHTIFEARTIEVLAQKIEELENEDYVEIEKVADQELYPASHAQKRLWILDHFQKDKTPYISTLNFRVQGDLKIGVLKQAFQLLIERHEVLRTTFLFKDGTPYQKIHDVAESPFTFEHINKEKDGLTFEQLTNEVLNVPVTFDLENGPLFYARLYQYEPEGYLLVCYINHIISDGWSLRILYEELMVIYDDLVNDHEVSLEPLRIQYRDYSAWHHQVITGREEAYWLKKLTAFPPVLNLPFDEGTSATEEYFAPREAFGDEESLKLKEIARKLGMTVNALMLAVFGLFLNKLTGVDDMLLGMTHANRNHKDIEGLIGFFINMLVIRIQSSEQDTLETFIKRTNQTCTEALGHSNYPLDLLIEKLCHKRYSDQQPLFNVMYDFKNFSDVVLDSESNRTSKDLEVEMIRLGEHASTHDLVLHIIESESTIYYEFEYRKGLFLQKTIRNFYKLFEGLTKVVIAELSDTK